MKTFFHQWGVIYHKEGLEKVYSMKTISKTMTETITMENPETSLKHGICHWKVSIKVKVSKPSEIAIKNKIKKNSLKYCYVNTGDLYNL